jgi:hypothetical protein
VVAIVLVTVIARVRAPRPLPERQPAAR